MAVGAPALRRWWLTIQPPPRWLDAGREPTRGNPAGKREPTDRAPAQAISILLVEDDADMARMYRRRLVREGFSVDVCHDGAQGLELLRGGSYDLLLLDVGLPKLDGLALLDTVRSDSALAALPVVVLTNYGDKRFIDRATRLGAIDYLIKAETTPGEIAAGVRRWVGR
jgi:DNA-binding response OmpR family regulator